MKKTLYILTIAISMAICLYFACFGYSVMGDTVITPQPPSGLGSVTLIQTGNGLAGGPITTSGTLVINTNTVITTNDAQVLTNKTINGSLNTLTNIYATLSGTSTTAGSANYATLSGSATTSGYATLSGVASSASYSTISGSSSIDAIKWNYINRDGFVLQDNNITFDATNYNFYLSPTNGSWQYMRQGTLETISGTKMINIGNPPTTGIYYIYITDEAGNLAVSNTSWTLTDNNIPVAIIDWNALCTPKYWLQTERHTAQMDRRTHWYLHSTKGAQPLTIGALSGYSVASGAPTDAHNTFTIEASSIADEDLQKNIVKLSNPSVTTANKYQVFFPVGTSYSWEALATPFRYTTAGYIQYNLSGVMTQGGGNKFINSYLLLTSISGEAGFMIIPGQNEYSTLANAQAEDPSQFSWTGFNLPEAVIVKKFVWETSAAYGTLGKCRLAVAPISVTIGITASTGNISLVHNSLSGLQGGAVGEYYHLTASREGMFQGFNNISTTGYITAETIKATTYIGIPAGTSVSSAGATSLTGAITLDAVGAGIKITQNGQRISFEVNATGGTTASLTAEVNKAGTVALWGSNTTPEGWLMCWGQSVSRTTYPDLFNNIGTTYGTGDGTSTFNVPDFRGASAFGAGTSTGYTSNETYVLGTKYNDQLQGWQLGASADATGVRDLWMQATTRDRADQNQIVASGYAPFYLSNTAGFQGSTSMLKAMNDGTNGTPRTGTTTRGKGVGVNYIIKHTNGIALVGVNGWTDGGTLVSLETITDKVNIGSSESRSKLSVYGTIETYGTGGIKFPDGTIQISSALTGTPSQAATGYIKLGSIWIQWGNFSSGDGSQTTVTYPVAFPTACVHFSGAQLGQSGADQYKNGWTLVSISKTATVVQNNTNGTNTYYWQAIGY